MLRSSHLAAACGCVVALATAGCGGQGAAPVSTGLQPFYGGGPLLRPHYALTRSAASRVVPLSVYIPYRGGLVIVAPKFYLIFWDYKKYGDADHLRPLLETYTKNMGGSGHNNIETQYYEKVHHKKIYISNPADQYGGSWNDEAPIPKSPSDPQIAAEALKGVAHFGFDPNGVYVVATAHKHSEAGFGTHWCSYHSDTEYNSTLIPYANLPYMTDAGKECGANIITPPSDESGTDEGMTIFGGHEYGESITDPYPYTGWWGVDGEIADPCAFVDIANDPFGSKSYTMQPMASDATTSCVQSYPSSS
jgi:hypothetical protein